jgi:hypothetical protein
LRLHRPETAALGLDEAVVARAAGLVAERRVTLLAVSGRLGSGKDTVARLVMDSLGHADAERLAVGTAVCAEGDVLVAAIAASGGDPARAAALGARALGVTAAAARPVVDRLWSAVTADGLETTTKRHPAVRPALELWGGTRRRRDPLFWIRPPMRRAAALAAEGRSSYLTDVRTPEEARWARKLGFVLVRLEVDAHTRRRRCARRDGGWNAAAACSALETALDGYEDFDVCVDNGDDCEPSVDMPAVRAVAAALRARRAA